MGWTISVVPYPAPVSPVDPYVRKRPLMLFFSIKIRKGVKDISYSWILVVIPCLSYLISQQRSSIYGKVTTLSTVMIVSVGKPVGSASDCLGHCPLWGHHGLYVSLLFFTKNLSIIFRDLVKCSEWVLWDWLKKKIMTTSDLVECLSVLKKHICKEKFSIIFHIHRN